jgi:hypothetical protein
MTRIRGFVFRDDFSQHLARAGFAFSPGALNIRIVCAFFVL